MDWPFGRRVWVCACGAQFVFPTRRFGPFDACPGCGRRVEEKEGRGEHQASLLPGEVRG
ncbi:MAG: hypothetical protein QXR87_06285 [Candidatus Hadarchaeales archaeon]